MLMRCLKLHGLMFDFRKPGLRMLICITPAGAGLAGALARNFK